ncbi:hypothetical protein DMH27_00905 [Raoultella planticola]|nr:hypothetical protein [Raoultella planticola]
MRLKNREIPTRGSEGGIAKDRESAYWLSLQEIPPKAGSANKLVIAVRSRLKVFVRPDGLNSAGARDAVKQIRWSLEKDGNAVWLKASNPTPYFVSFARLSVGPARDYVGGSSSYASAVW